MDKDKYSHYVYVFRDPRKDGNPIFYVGKGTKKIINENRGRNQHTTRVMKKIGYKNVIREIAYFFEYEEDAYKCEKEYIQFYRLENLTNMTEGGRGASSGESHPFFGTSGPFFGKKHTEETKRKISEAQNGDSNYMRGRKGPLSPNFGIKVPEEQKKRQSEILKGKYCGENSFNFRKDLPRDKIRELYATGNYSWQDLSSKFNCCKRTIGNIIHKKYKGNK